VSKQLARCVAGERALSKYSYLNLIKRHAKAYARAPGLKLSAAQEQFATEFGFADFHELTTVAARNSNDPSPMRAALGTSNLGELLEEESVYQALVFEVEDALSGDMAETNAYVFTIEDLEVIEAAYDASTGTALLTVAFSYAGEQDPDRAYNGSTFYVNANVQLQRRSGSWELLDEDGLDIFGCETDFYRDYLAEQETARLA
jgi:hypothetical protein